MMQPSPSMLLQAACNRLGFVYAEIWLPRGSPNGTMLALHATSANEDDLDDPMRAFATESRRISLASGSGLPGRVWSTRQPEWSIDVRESPASRFVRVTIAKTTGLAAAVGIPLLSPTDSTFVGVAVFFAQQRAQSTVQIMQALGNVGAMLAYHLTGSSVLMVHQQQPGQLMHGGAPPAHSAAADGAVRSPSRLAHCAGGGGGGMMGGGYAIAQPTALAHAAAAADDMTALTEFAGAVSRMVQMGLLQAGLEGAGAALEQLAAQLMHAVNLLAARRGGMRPPHAQQLAAGCAHAHAHNGGGACAGGAHAAGGPAAHASSAKRSAVAAGLGDDEPGRAGAERATRPALDGAPACADESGASHQRAAGGGHGHGGGGSGLVSSRFAGGPSASAPPFGERPAPAHAAPHHAHVPPLPMPRSSPFLKPRSPFLRPDADDLALLEIDLASLVDFVESTEDVPLDPTEANAAFGSMLQKTLAGADASRGGGGGAGGSWQGDGDADAGVDDGDDDDGEGDGEGDGDGEAEAEAEAGGGKADRAEGGGDSEAKPRRVRKGKELSFADVSRHFDLPLTQAAEQLNVCVTLVKRVCRENGVSRWPFRKLQSRKKKERIAHEASGGAAGLHAMQPQQPAGGYPPLFFNPGQPPPPPMGSLHAPQAWQIPGAPPSAPPWPGMPGSLQPNPWGLQ